MLSTKERAVFCSLTRFVTGIQLAVLVFTIREGSPNLNPCWNHAKNLSPLIICFIQLVSPSNTPNAHLPFHSGFFFSFFFIYCQQACGIARYETCSSCPAYTHRSSDSCLDRKNRPYIQYRQKMWHLGTMFMLCNQTSFSTLSSVSGRHVSSWQGTIRFNVKPFLCFLFPAGSVLKWMQPGAHS